jgi:hypothetical protein
MIHVRGRTLPVLLGAAVLVGGANLAAYAANGHAFLLGVTNSESRPASVTNTGRGPALSLHAGPGSAPLAVSNDRKVVHLNADAVDGSNAQALRTNVFTYPVPSGTSVPFDLTLAGLPAGRYLASFSVFMHTTAGAAPSICDLESDLPPTQLVSYGPVFGSGFSTSNASGLVTQFAGHPLLLFCNNATSVVDTSSTLSQVTLTPVSGVITGSLVPAFRTPPRRSTGR